MTTYHKRHTQSVESEKWIIDLPEGAKFPKVDQIYNLNGNPVSWTYQQAVNEDGDLVVDFGLDQVSGIAEYTYETDGDSEVDPVIGQDGGTINVHIHQYNSGGVSNPK